MIFYLEFFKKITHRKNIKLGPMIMIQLNIIRNILGTHLKGLRSRKTSKNIFHWK